MSARVRNDENKRKRSREDGDSSDEEFRPMAGGAKTVKRRAISLGIVGNNELKDSIGN